MIEVWIAILAVVASALLAALALLRRPRTMPVWSFAAGMACLSIETGLAALATLMPERMLYWHHWRLLVLSFLPGTWVLFSLTYARGNAREFVARWRVPLITAFIGPPAVALLFSKALILPSDHIGPDYEWGLSLGTAGRFLYVLVLVGCILVLMNLERTFRSSVGTMRWRIKFMILGVGLLFAARTYTTSQAIVFHSVISSLQTVNAVALVLACGVIAISITRTSYFEVNVYPSRKVLRNSLTFLIAGVYLLIVGVFAETVTFMGGDAAFPLKAFAVLAALLLLAVLLVSERFRLHANEFISRHFQRPLHDYRVIWNRFIQATTSCVHQTDLSRAIVRLACDIFQALSATIWLVDNERQRLAFAASTSIAELDGPNLEPSGPEALEAIQGLRNVQRPVDIDATQERWAEVLRQCTPGDFKKGGHRVCVPLSAGGNLLGVLILGDRVGGVRFSTQDLDLLKCIGDQAAASLLNIQLSQRLMQARELEAFQAMSAFFVHDLKNTASTLSLMLQNLPVHFDDPEFRADALRGISRTVQHVNNIISRLTLLRQELAIQPVEVDLSQLVRETVQGMNADSGVDLSLDLAPMRKVALDPDQVRKVITNLVLNAREAVNGNGVIRVSTREENGWAILSVSDNGCGMTREFLSKSLFKPFQTTKKSGIGIGMFQSRMIVEAHRGRIEVQSEPGKGTTFRVWFPCLRQDS
ncbi:MAG TPA: PEP-CTERM system histidine kinase PrsK [Verrucomicrobiota bacterium]|nr:PEP-CTERM system histidine kinase PrsK [Verrucomicrobiota bacterium]